MTPKIDHAYLHGKQSQSCRAFVRTPDRGGWEFCGRSRAEHNTLDTLSERIADAERRVAERDAAGYETPTAAIARLAHARTEWANGRRHNAMVEEGFLDDDKLRPFVETITRDLDRFDEILSAQHAADVGPVEDEEPQC